MSNVPPKDLAAPGPKRRSRGRPLGLAVSLGCHLLILGALWAAWIKAPAPEGGAPVSLALVGDPRPAAPAPRSPQAAPRDATPRPHPPIAAHAVATAPPEPLPAARAPTVEPGVEVSEAELAGATGAGEGAGGIGGAGGGGCDMAAALQAALRKDPLVLAAVAPSGNSTAGRALRVWNGDWVAHPGQDGKGLAAVREAIIWEVAFAPKRCRTAPVQGLVVISLGEVGSRARLVVGADRWRWSDLLGVSEPLSR